MQPLLLWGSADAPVRPPRCRCPPACGMPVWPQVFVGNHAKQVAAWVPPAAELDSNVRHPCIQIATTCAAGFGCTCRCLPSHGCRHASACAVLPAGRHCFETCPTCPHTPGPAPPLFPVQVLLDDHCGWVRSLAMAGGRWLFSCACNTLRQVRPAAGGWCSCLCGGLQGLHGWLRSSLLLADDCGGRACSSLWRCLLLFAAAMFQLLLSPPPA